MIPNGSACYGPRRRGPRSPEPSRACRYPHPPHPPRGAGAAAFLLQAGATDSAGLTQPGSATFDTLGYQFDGIVRHPVTVA